MLLLSSLPTLPSGSALSFLSEIVFLALLELLSFYRAIDNAVALVTSFSHYQGPLLCLFEIIFDRAFDFFIAIFWFMIVPCFFELLFSSARDPPWRSCYLFFALSIVII
eukprot:m.168112 g.168112  ORF g.168112 m.168112 type:complete len:109 (-) comp53190_c0_seq1:563-889(-)